MTGHRRIPNRRGFVPSSWAIVVAVVACVAAAGWLGVELMNPDSSSAKAGDGSTASKAVATTATPTPSATTTTPSPSPSPSVTTAEPIERTAPVSILNNTGIRNLAASYSTKVQSAGWTIGGVGNWRGQIVSNTVYFPPQLQDQARQLAKDVGIDRVMPSIVPMKMDRLTIILSGPQQ